MNSAVRLTVILSGLSILSGCGAEQFQPPNFGTGGASGAAVDSGTAIDLAAGGAGGSGTGGDLAPPDDGGGADDVAPDLTVGTGGAGGTPIDANGAGGDAGVDAVDPCATAANPTLDTDGDGLPDCAEDGDGDPWTDRTVFNGFSVTVKANGSSGTCADLADYNAMSGRFAAPTETKSMYAGWSFDTDQDRYYDPSYGFKPNWSTTVGGSFRVRYRGVIDLKVAGQHCFKVDVGSTGAAAPDSCGQVYLNASPGRTWLVENGVQATAGAGQACVNLPAGQYPLEIVFQYGSATDRHKLSVLYCAGGANSCTPTAPLTQAMVRPLGCVSSADCDCQFYGGHAYRFCKVGHAFTDAEASCVAQNMRLIRIDNDAENAWAYATKQAETMPTTWIGATDAVTEGDWRWIDNTPFWSGLGATAGGKPVGGLYNNWDTGAAEPNQTGDEDCGGFWYAVPTWADLTCTDANAYICEAY
ncbi:MAG TPA: lectin-like protein [Polyangia bacterium]|jgi:hypothetical protein